MARPQADIHRIAAHLFFIPVFAIWSVIIMAVNALVIYGLTVHGGACE